MFERLNAYREIALRWGANAVALSRDADVRERFWAAGAFALIFFAFAASVDYLISGGPDWNPTPSEAYAAALPHAAPAASPVVVVTTAALEAKAAAEEALEEPLVEEIDYSVTTETLLGGPDTILPNAYDVDVLARPIEINFSSDLDAVLQTPISASLSASPW